MNYIINRDFTMALHALIVFAVFLCVRFVIAKLRNRPMKRTSAVLYSVAAVIFALWNYMYSSFDCFKHNNGLLGGYLMMFVPVVGAIFVTAVDSVRKFR